jgi:hypothetical protein
MCERATVATKAMALLEEAAWLRLEELLANKVLPTCGSGHIEVKVQ